MTTGATARIRPLRRTDLDDVMALERAIFPTPWRREHFERLLDSPLSIGLAAERGGRTSGYALGWAVAGEAELANLAVAEGVRRRGVGGRLLEAFLAAAARRGARRAYLEVREGNDPARAFYRRHGFVAVGRRPGYYRSPVEDAVTMAREVEPPAVDARRGAPVALTPTPRPRPPDLRPPGDDLHAHDRPAASREGAASPAADPPGSTHGARRPEGGRP